MPLLSGVTMSDRIEGKIVVDVTRSHAWVYLCDGDGVILDQDSFRWPFRLDRKDAGVEASNIHGVLFDYLNDSCNVGWDDTDAASAGEESPDSE